MVEKIFGILFIVIAIFLAKTVFYPEAQTTKPKKKIVKNQPQVNSAVASAPASASAPESSAAPVPIPEYVINDKLIAKIVSETEKITEIEFAKNQINNIEVRSEENEEIKLRIQKAFRYIFPSHADAVYYLELEVFRNPETSELILQGSIFDQASSNKISEFGLTVSLNEKK